MDKWFFEYSNPPRRPLNKRPILALLIGGFILLGVITISEAVTMENGTIVDTDSNQTLYVDQQINFSSVSVHGNISFSNLTYSYNLTFETIAFMSPNSSVNVSQLPIVNTSLNVWNERHLTSTSIHYNFSAVNITTVVPYCTNITTVAWGLPDSSISYHTGGWACNNNRMTLAVGTIQTPTTATLTNYLRFGFDTWTTNFTIYDEETYIKLTGTNVSFVVIHDNLSMNMTTDAGSILINTTPLGEYEIRYTAGDYVERTYWFTASLGNNTGEDLFLLNESLSTNIIATIEDESGNFLEGYQIKARRYYPTPNAYITIEMATTDNQGQALLHLKRDSEWYDFVIQHNGRTVTTTSTKQILANNIYFVVDLLEDYLATLKNVQGLYTALTYDNDTYTFSYTWNDANNFVREACLEVKRQRFTGQTVLTDTCQTATSGTLNYAINPNQTGLYAARGYIDSVSNFSTYTTDVLTWRVDAGGIAVIGITGLFLGVFVIGTVALIGAWNPAVAIVGAILAMLIGSFTGFWVIAAEGLVALIIVGLIIAIKGKT